MVAGDIVLPRDRVQVIQGTDDRWFSVTTGTGQGFTGFVSGGPITFAMDLGPEIEVPASKIASLTVEDTRELSTNGYFIILQNGDVLTGEVEPRSIMLETDEGEQSLDFDAIHFIGFAGRERAVTRVKWFNEKTSIGFVVHDGNGDDRCAAKLR